MFLNCILIALITHPARQFPSLSGGSVSVLFGGVVFAVWTSFRSVWGVRRGLSFHWSIVPRLKRACLCSWKLPLRLKRATETNALQNEMNRSRFNWLIIRFTLRAEEHLSLADNWNHTRPYAEHTSPTQLYCVGNISTCI